MYHLIYNNVETLSKKNYNNVKDIINSTIQVLQIYVSTF